MKTTKKVMGNEMNEYVIIRHDSNADGAGRHSALTMGVLEAADHRAAVAKAHDLFVRNEYQWIEAESVKRLKKAKVNAARRVWEYKNEPV